MIYYSFDKELSAINNNCYNFLNEPIIYLLSNQWWHTLVLLS